MTDLTRTPEAGLGTASRPIPREAVGVPERKLVLGLMEAARLLGIGRTTAYRLAKTGTFPCLVIRIGGRYAVPQRGLRALLGYADHHNGESHGHDREEGTEEERLHPMG
ncbi:helix-turn-helix domain-containing protein [Nonomuraea rubra]|uniref:Putative DNA-binding transcriptional regulator AlpA n=1 Tax=Nonomuraea rubra TaxID=46180 RepID=A0A7X0NP23_9ACTN|nr:helix-turn-helix domain-containing protein [Nonomuraea rubra]MBB6546920.1 putative DNA-binding transcriptional regulator AlpA [Nonomuraea rubra]